MVEGCFWGVVLGWLGGFGVIFGVVWGLFFGDDFGMVGVLKVILGYFEVVGGCFLG